MSVPESLLPASTLRLADDADVSNWLEALEAGECTPEQFIEEILRREQEEPDVGWEALALLDQQFRRHKISRDDFATLKATLYQHFLQSGSDAPLAAPSPMVAVRAVPLVDIPVITTSFKTPVPNEPVDITLHGEVRVGDKLCDRYRVVEILRRNNSGTLVEAIDELKIELPGIRKRVAIQMVDEALSREQDFLSRIGQLQSLSHPAIARLFDVEEYDGALLLITELLNGPSLHDLQSRAGGKSLHASVTQSALRAVASALSYAHSQGITHGDVSAMNVIMTQAGDFRLQGFEMQDTRHRADAAADRLAFARLAHRVLAHTDPGSTLHRPPGMSREQWHLLRDVLHGKDDPRRDVLNAFASDAPAASSRGWTAVTGIAVILGIAGLLYANGRYSTPIAPAAVAVAPAVAVLPAATTTGAVAAPLPSEVAAPEPVSAVIVATPPGKPRIDLPAGPSVVDTTAPVARIWVRRRGSLEGPVTFKWWTENGSAAADRDFRRVEPRMEVIPDGANGIEVLVPLMPDPERREPRTFWVKIDEPVRATMGARTLMQVAIVPPGYPVQR